MVHNRVELKNSLKHCKKPIIQEIVGNQKNEYTCGSVFIENEVLTTISLMPLSTVSSILQALPLFITFGAVLI